MMNKSTETTMGILSDSLFSLIEQMKESDRRTEALIQEHVARANRLLDELADLDKEPLM